MHKYNCHNGHNLYLVRIRVGNNNIGKLSEIKSEFLNY